MIGRIDSTLKPVKVDAKDLKILACLAKNSRESLNVIAKQALLSRDAVRYRINRLVKLGVILRFTAMVNLKSFGYHSYHVFLHLEEMEDEQEKQLFEFFERQPNIMSVMEYSDEWDLEIAIVAKTVEDFDAILTEMITAFPGVISDFETLDTVKYYHESFLPKEISEPAVEHRAAATAEIDEQDINIIGELCNDASQPLFKIGEKVNLSADAISYRIKKLLSQGVIQQFTIIVNFSLLRYNMYTLFFRFHSFQPKTEMKLKQIISQDPLVQSGMKAIGKWNIVVRVLARTPEEFHQSLKEFRKAFKQEIGFYDTLLAYHEHYFEVFAPQLVSHG